MYLLKRDRVNCSNRLYSTITYLFVVWMGEKSSLRFGILRTPPDSFRKTLMRSGQEDYERLRPLSYNKAHVILIGFAVNAPDSLDNVSSKVRPGKLSANVSVVRRSESSMSRNAHCTCGFEDRSS